MEWDKLYDQSNQPTYDKISEFINNKLWYEFNKFIEDTYNTVPKQQMFIAKRLEYQIQKKRKVIVYAIPNARLLYCFGCNR